MEPQTQSDSPDARQAAALAQGADEATAALLARHSAGEKLTPKEYGTIGSWVSKLKRSWPFGKDGAAPGQTSGASGDAALVATGAQGQTPDDRLAPVPVNPGLVTRTTGSILTRIDLFTQGYVERHAVAAGATGKTLDRFRDSACLAPADRKLLAELSPDVCAELGISPRALALGAVSLIFLFHGANLWSAVQELKEMRQQPAPKPPQARPEANGSMNAMTPPLPLPTPQRPRGAPPEVT
jgi:hypothetical protein